MPGLLLFMAFAHITVSGAIFYLLDFQRRRERRGKERRELSK
jgi:hypothetical protein